MPDPPAGRVGRCLLLLTVACWWIPTGDLGAEPPRGRRQPSDFKQLADVGGEAALAVGQAYSIPLSSEAVAALRKGREVRVFDALGVEIPSLVHTAYSRAEAEKLPVKVFNAAWEPGLVQTLSVEIDERTLREVNEFRFEIEEEEYNLRVRVEGSEEGRSWLILKQDLHLIRHLLPSQKIDYVHNALRIPTSRFRFYRFTMSAPGREKPLTIEHVSVRKMVPRGASLGVPVKLEAWSNPRDQDERHDYWKLDLGRPDLGVDQLALRIEGEEFARNASLWEWNEVLDRPGKRLANTVLFDYEGDSQREFKGFSSDAQRLVVRIDQGDDLPVGLSGAYASRPMQQLRLLIASRVDLPLRLYFLPERADKPKYDLARRLRERDITDYRLLAHAALVDNPDYAPPPAPASERSPYLLYILVGGLVIGLGGYVAYTLRDGLPS